MTAERARPVSQDSRIGKDASSTSQSAAMRGASLAFGKPPVKPKPQIDTFPGKNGALATATKVGAGSRAGSRSASTTILGISADTQQLAYQQTGDSNVSRNYTGNSERGNSRMSRVDRIGSGFLQLPGNAVESSKSPSFIAAALAASRSASISPNPTGQQQLSPRELRRQSSFNRRSTSSVRSVSPSRESFDQALDTTSIPPTTSLIGLFEQNAVSPQAIKRPANRRSATTASMKPSTEFQRPKSPLPVRTRTPPPLISPKPRKPEIKSPKPLLATLARNFEPLEPPPPLSAAKPPITAAKPIPIPSKSISHKATGTEDNASSDDSFLSASDYRPSFRASLQHQNRKLTSPSAVSVNSAVTIDSLANAIVASSLASSRAASPSKSLSTSLYPPPPPPSRRSPRGHLFHNSKEMSRTPSPAKAGGMRTTMRKPKLEEDVDEGEKRRSKKNLMKKHPNKHHEGDRKRWRDEITERERKRYEAVWASNKGLYLSSFLGSETSVCSLVARDIYSRSRLHTEVLEEVYALVDRRKDGRLEKEEFVVGLWLIDQRLKGRKLPPRISDFVWRSVGILAGIKVKKAGK